MTPHEWYVMQIADRRGIDMQMMLDALGIVSARGPGRQIRQHVNMSPDDEQKAMRLRLSGKSYEQIGRMLGHGKETVRMHLRRMGL